MFISRLIRIIENYDQYGTHRVNGIKVVYVLLALFFFNSVFYIPNVYFYYFYIPITAMTVEVLFERIQDKYRAFIYVMVGTCVMVFLFNILKPYPLFFLFAVFVSAMLLYLLALHWRRIFLPIVPVILSLASYSLLYPNLNANLNMVVNNAVTTLFALIIILSALVLFPLSYYYRLWLRSFGLLLEETLDHLRMIQDKKPVQVLLVQGHTKHMITFANMLSRKLPTFTLLKINLLTNRLHMESCVPHGQFTAMQPEERIALITYFSGFIEAVKREKPYEIAHVNSLLLKLVQAWNDLCLKI